MRLCLVLVALLLTTRAQAQECEACPDPVAAEIAALRLEKLSLFWPSTAITLGTGTLAAGLWTAFDDRHQKVSTTATVISVGALALAGGIWWTVARVRGRGPTEQRIAELLQQPVSPEQRRSLLATRRSLAAPIAVTTLGSVATALGVVLVPIGILQTAFGGDSDGTAAATAGAILITLGGATAIGGGFWLRRERALKRAYDERLDLTRAPFLIRF